MGFVETLKRLSKANCMADREEKLDSAEEILNVLY